MGLKLLPLWAVLLGLVGCAGASSPVASSDSKTETAAVTPGPTIAELKRLFPAVEPGQVPDPADSILFWSPERQRAGYQSLGLMLPTRELSTGEQIYPLLPADADKTAVLVDLRYNHDGVERSLDEYMTANNAGGLLVLQGNRVLYERYGLSNSQDSLWVSFSVAKSVTSLLIGAAVRDGYIKSLDEPVTTYLPRLAGSAYANSSIRDVLQMSSGVRWNEDYADPNSDVSKAGGLDGLALVKYLQALPREHEPGGTFNYNTAETNLVGALLRSAIGNNLSTYASQKIWRGFGMEATANWLLNGPDGVELGGCCISATLRDYGRIGRFVLEEKAGRGDAAILPPGWIEESTQPSKGFPGYGYLWWLREESAFAALGVFGQMIFIDPERDLVIALHSAWPAAVGEPYGSHRMAMVAAIRAAL